MKCFWMMADEGLLADAKYVKELSNQEIGTQSLNALNEVLYSDEMQADIGEVTELRFFETETGVYAAATTTETEIVFRRSCAGSNIALYIGAGAVGAGIGLAVGHFAAPVGKLPGATIGMAAGLIGGFLLKQYMHGSVAGLNVIRTTYAGRR